MGALEDDTQVFIVRFWPEPREPSGGQAEWRGVVEHIKSGARRFVHHPDEVALFIDAYVATGAPHRSFMSRVKRWMKGAMAISLGFGWLFK